MEMGYFWQIGDGRIWSADDAAFVAESSAGMESIPLYVNGDPAGIDYLRDTIKFYGYGLGELAGPEELEAAFSALVTDLLDTFARQKQYDNIASARLAALSTEYTTDGQAANAAYDETWTAAIALVSQVRSGELTPEQAVEQLPALMWPGD
jgi:hypothetical protein